MRKSAQILATVLFTLVIVTIVVFSLVQITSRDTRQVAANVDFNASLTASEQNLLAYNNLLSQVLPLDQIIPTLPGNCTLQAANELTYICEQSIEGRNTVTRIVETNRVEDFRINVGQYFDLVLAGNSPKFDIVWQDANTALDLELVYTIGGQPYSARQVFDIRGPNQNFKFDLTEGYEDNDVGFLKKAGDIVERELNQRTFNVNLTDRGFLKPDIPISARFEYLRVKFINKNTNGESLTIIPDTSNLPPQVRRIDSVSFSPGSSQPATPRIITQVPLSPSVPEIFNSSLNFAAQFSPWCGNQINDGAVNQVNFNNCDTGLCKGDNEITVSEEKSLCIEQTTQLSTGGDLDDILVLIRPEDEVERVEYFDSDGDAGLTYYFPFPYLMFIPTIGTIDGEPKFFWGNNDADGLADVSLECSKKKYCFGADFAGAGFNIVDFGTASAVDQLGDFIEPGESFARFKIFHMGDGAGHAIDIRIEAR